LAEPARLWSLLYDVLGGDRLALLASLRTAYVSIRLHMQQTSARSTSVPGKQVK
jgi:hypothetical protein